MWDGVITSYAAETGNFAGLRYIADSAGLGLSVGLAEFLIGLGEFTGLGFHLVNDLASIASLLLLVCEVRLFARNIFRLPLPWAVLSASLVAVFPIWSTLLSSIVTYYILALALGFLAVRLIHQSNKVVQLIGLVAALVSFGFSSMLVLLPILSFTADILKNEDHQKGRLCLPSGQTWILFSSSMIFYLGQRTFSTPSGAYAGYNSLLNPFKLNSYHEVVLGIVNFSSYLLLPGAGISIAVLLLSLSNRRSFVSVQNKLDVSRSRAIVVIVVASIFPYLAVGASSSLRPFDWSQRHAFVLAPAIAFFTAILLLSLFAPALKANLKVKRIAALSIGAVLVLQVGFLAVGFVSKINHQIFENDLEQLLANLSPRPPEGVLQIAVEGMPWRTVFFDYDANYLLYTATNSAGYYTRIAADLDPNFGVPDIFTSGSVPTSFYVYEDKGSLCTTEIFVSTTGYSGYRSAISNVVGIGGNPTMKMTGYSSDCLGERKFVVFRN